ncbi:MAG: hypothetical protein COV36_05150 [Alphaproteobacteria bacterium CG11_big_fil_rev_8_21_14_0_20_44_7]|nr:MAG: hypothetical protein COV36_05150 [Alphaproteobacteria bacterium CG11_big_fil_rev_8_21_14_0_20_44_7]
MVKPLKTLIRLSKNEVDAKRKELVALEKIKQGFVESHDALRERLAEEARICAELPEASGSYGSFAKVTLEKLEKISAEIARLEAKIEKMRQEMHILFAEQKKYEIALDNKQTAIKQESDKKDTQNLDEIATIGYVRGKKA